MSEALQLETAVTDINQAMRRNDGKPLNQCVAEAMAEYFRHLDGYPSGELYKLVLAEVEEPLLRAVLDYTQGNQSKASELLGINRGTLRKKLKLYGLHE
ncbi:MAG: DNA-binding transcriptional regulator Fis [Proteobacteria bacterium]|jgi:Fis family transcriptional regulator, factor for inversion stimulation protein|nr:DNA-binding transcriptional regulator Fis [Pseudomonadota bacterium]MCG6935658.1 DNA-binding transcriptional regulator Fis [Pseudomonadota bacterium]